MLTVSHFPQEVPLAFKKYTKKRSWVWDWIEQDTENKFRAICIYCQKEIFRLDGDRGSPKKLITHVNSKHGINKENYQNAEMTKMRIIKLKEYISTVGPLTTNHDDAIQLGAIKNDILDHSEERPRISKTSTLRHLELDSIERENNHQPLQVKVLDASKFNKTMMISNSTTKINTSPSIPESRNPQQEYHKSNQHEKHHQLQHQPPIQVDPNLQDLTVQSDEVENYNYLVRMHNFQVEQYNKTVITSSSPRPSGLKRFKPLIKDFITEEQAALKEFLEENHHCFNNLTFLESDSFKKLIQSNI